MANISGIPPQIPLSAMPSPATGSLQTARADLVRRTSTANGPVLFGGTEDLQAAVAASCGQEDILAIVSALSDVVGEPWFYKSSSARHVTLVARREFGRGQVGNPPHC
jgi:hypothetical protein